MQAMYDVLQQRLKQGLNCQQPVLQYETSLHAVLHLANSCACLRIWACTQHVQCTSAQKFNFSAASVSHGLSSAGAAPTASARQC